MTYTMESDPSIIGAFADQQIAEKALNALQESGLPAENFSLALQTPPVSATKAGKNAEKGAIAGALCGAIVGFILSYGRTNFAQTISSDSSIRNMIGMILAGSLVGAAGLGVMAAITGVNVMKQDGAEISALEPNFLVFVKDLQSEDIVKAKRILIQNGSQIQE
ncbi:hypothetical protein AB3R30_15925 [Leptolyngbyaceae cyanobacterium UHCC 1019]